MNILKQIGLGPKKKKESLTGVGLTSAKEKQESTEKRNRYLRVLILTFFLVLVLFSLPQSSFQPVESYTIGEPWRADDLTAPFTFSIRKTDAELEQEREEIRELTPPIFHVEPNALLQAETDIDIIFRDLQPVLESYLQWQRSLLSDAASQSNDSLRYIQERNHSAENLEDESWTLLLDDYASIILNNQPEHRTIVNQIRSQLLELVRITLSDGIINLEKSAVTQDEITIRNLQQQTERTRRLNTTRDLSQAYEFANIQFNRAFIPQVSRIANHFFTDVIRPNLIYSEADTRTLLNEKFADISTTRGAVDQGEIIIRRGDIVTEATDIRLRSLAEARAQTATELERWLRFTGESIVIIITIMMFFFYIYLYRRKIFDQISMFLLVFLIIGLVILASAAIYPIENVRSYAVPVAIAPILLTIIFDSRVGLMATITLAIITGMIHDYSFEYLVATTTACSLGVFSVRDIKKRSQFFFITPGIVFMSYILVVAGFGLARYSGWQPFLSDTFFIALNSVFILFTYPLILLFERLFKVTTDFSLLELADTNLPLMKELMNKAPGTFHHSLQVANLSEAAAADIGANSLLCRVGGMYHDIGKMTKPIYFIENQNQSNEHDNLKPRMSALVIKAHVSDGVKIAEEHNLPEVIRNFIITHHGTSMIRYFLQKAQQESDDIQEEDFRYDGPLPSTKEEGIVMLADGIEASCRAMKNTTYSKLENQINRIVDSLISDGQLSRCPLTFQQIQIIKESFLRVLKGVYHSRIEYPDEKKAESDLQEAPTEPETDVRTDSNES